MLRRAADTDTAQQQQFIWVEVSHGRYVKRDRREVEREQAEEAAKQALVIERKAPAPEPEVEPPQLVVLRHVVPTKAPLAPSPTLRYELRKVVREDHDHVVEETDNDKQVHASEMEDHIETKKPRHEDKNPQEGSVSSAPSTPTRSPVAAPAISLPVVDLDLDLTKAPSSPSKIAMDDVATTSSSASPEEEEDVAPSTPRRAAPIQNPENEVEDARGAIAKLAISSPPPSTSTSTSTTTTRHVSIAAPASPQPSRLKPPMVVSKITIPPPSVPTTPRAFKPSMTVGKSAPPPLRSVVAKSPRTRMRKGSVRLLETTPCTVRHNATQTHKFYAYATDSMRRESLSHRQDELLAKQNLALQQRLNQVSSRLFEFTKDPRYQQQVEEARRRREALQKRAEEARRRRVGNCKSVRT